MRARRPLGNQPALRITADLVARAILSRASIFTNVDAATSVRILASCNSYVPRLEDVGIISVLDLSGPSWAVNRVSDVLIMQVIWASGGAISRASYPCRSR